MLSDASGAPSDAAWGTQTILALIPLMISIGLGRLTAVAGDADLLPGSVHLAMSTASVPIQRLSDGAPVVGETPPPINTIARLT
jgi:hypothetical protein